MSNKTILISIILILLLSGCTDNPQPSTTTTTQPQVTTTVKQTTTTSTTIKTTTTSSTLTSTTHMTTTTLSGDTIKIGAFNIQIFGKTTREKEEVMEVLVRIAREFDVMLVQEIRDATETTAPYFLERINDESGSTYAFIRSERLGRSSSKEAYAYFYNTDTVQVIGNDYVYDDTSDVFEREPYIASFKSGNFDFTLAGIHTKPDDAESEISHLHDVVQSILTLDPDEKDVIVMGDFNADGTYFDEDSYGPFKTPETQSALPVYRWIITNDMDTMTKTDWTYDRIVIVQETVSEYVWDSANVFYFDSEYGITNQTLIEDVSDHYPVYGEFRVGLMDDD